MGGGDLHHSEEPELRVDIDHRPVRGEREGRVAVPLAVLVELGGRRVMELSGVLVLTALESAGNGDERSPVGHDPLPLDGEELPVHIVLGGRRVEDLRGDATAGLEDRSSRHPGLTRGRGRTGRPDGGVDGLERHVGYPEFGPSDLERDGDEALTDLGGREFQTRPTVPDDAPRGGEVVEALGVHQVLDRHRHANPAHHTVIAGQSRSSRRRQHVPVGVLLGHGKRHGLGDTARHRRDIVDGLTGDQSIAGLHGVPQTDVHRVETAGLCQQVHLTLMCETGLHHAETPHRAAREVIRTHRPPLDVGVLAAVRTLGMGHRVDQHGRGRRRVRPAIEHEAGLDLPQGSVAVGVVSHPDPRGMPVHVTDEALGPGVGGADGSPGHQSKEGYVHLEGDVLTASERTAHASEGQPDPFLLETEAGGDLTAILVEPLGSHEEFQARAVGVGHRDRGLQSEERLILHADLVGALDGDLTDEVDITPTDPLVSDHVPVRVNRLEGAVHRPLGVDQGFEYLVDHHDRLDGARAGLRVGGGHRCDGLTDEAHLLGGEDRLIPADEPESVDSRNIGRRDHGSHAWNRQGRSRVDRDDSRPRVRRAEGHRPEFTVDAPIGGELV